MPQVPLTPPSPNPRLEHRHGQVVGADLSGQELDGANFTGADLAGADLTAADLSGAHLQGASLARGVLANARLEGARMEKASLDGADLTGVSWGGARGAAIAVFHARNAAHQMTGHALDGIADSLVGKQYAQQIGPELEHPRSAGVDITPQTEHAPPPFPGPENAPRMSQSAGTMPIL